MTLLILCLGPISEVSDSPSSGREAKAIIGRIMASIITPHEGNSETTLMLS